MKLKEKIAFEHMFPHVQNDNDIIQAYSHILAFVTGWEACRKALLETVDPINKDVIVMLIDKLKTFGDEEV